MKKLLKKKLKRKLKGRKLEIFVMFISKDMIKYQRRLVLFLADQKIQICHQNNQIKLNQMMKRKRKRMMFQRNMIRELDKS